MSLVQAESTQRLFFALWPDAVVQASLDQAAHGLLGKRIKRVPAANLHMTLAFAGSVTAPVRSCLEAAAGTIRLPAFDLNIALVGHWPKPRIVWLAPTHAPAALWSLVAALRGVFDDCGLQRETRPYQPHITLARKQREPLAATRTAPIDWSIGQFCLVESVTDPAGVSYRVLASWTLESE